MTPREALEQTLDSGIANRYIWAYLTIALEHAGFDLDDCDRVVDGMRYALDSYTAREAFEYTEER